jgi:PAS domain S-box-containing protein
VNSESASILGSTVLVVDDTPANLELMMGVLEAQGLCVETATDGAECLRRAESIRPDIILLDVVMPGLDGFEVAQCLKRLPSLRDTPIIFMTALTGIEEKVRGFQAGGVDYVTKPLQIEEVSARVNTHLRLYLADRAERMQRAAAEQRYQRLFEAATDGILLASAQTGVVLDANPAMLAMIGGEPLSVIGTHLWEVQGFGGLCDCSTAYEDMVELASPVVKEGVLRPPGRRAVDVEVASSTFRAGSVRIFQCNIRDVTERNRLRRGLVDATDREQLRLAREIHDGLGQELAGLDLLIHGLAKRGQNAEVSRSAGLERLTAITRHAIATCHNIAQGLSPLSSVGGELVEALHSLKERLNGPPGPVLELLIVRKAPIAVGTDACNHVYRIAQEAVSNAIKHAQPARIQIRLLVDSEALELEVSDDGCGMSKAPSRRRGLGLQTMRDRAETIGAALHIRAATTGGTAVTCRVPQARPVSGVRMPANL